MKTKKRKGKIHQVFEDRAEFHNFYGPEAPPLAPDWRTAKVGEWVEADDGGIVQILKRGNLPHPHDRPNYKAHKGWVRTIVGTFPCNDKTLMDTDFDQHPQPYTFSKKSQAEQKQAQAEREALSKGETIFTTAIMSGKSLQTAYEEAYGPHVSWRERAVAILKRKRIIKMLNKNVEEIAEKLGLDYEYILSRLMKLSDSDKNEGVALGALRELAEWLGAKDKTKQITQGQIKVFQPFADDELASIEAERIEALTEGEE
jgi:hypothetical protein